MWNGWGTNMLQQLLQPKKCAKSVTSFDPHTSFAFYSGLFPFANEAA